MENEESFMEEIARRGRDQRLRDDLPSRYPPIQPTTNTKNSIAAKIKKFLSKVTPWIITNIGKFIFYVCVAIVAAYFILKFKLYPH